MRPPSASTMPRAMYRRLPTTCARRSASPTTSSVGGESRLIACRSEIRLGQQSDVAIDRGERCGQIVHDHGDEVLFWGLRVIAVPLPDNSASRKRYRRIRNTRAPVYIFLSSASVSSFVAA